MDHATHPAPTEPQPGQRAAAPYHMRGEFLEACDCYTICPCWVGRAPDDGSCAGVVAWRIADGEIDGVDVSGRIVVSASIHTGSRHEAHQRVVIFIDSGADDAKAALLAAAFAGELGGPLEELAALADVVEAAERADIAIEQLGRTTRLRVGKLVDVEATGKSDSRGEPVRLVNGALGGVLGAEADVGVARRLKVGLPWSGFDIDLRGRSAMQGRFDYRHTP